MVEFFRSRFIFIIARILAFCLLDNPFLGDFYYILDVQIDANSATSIQNNSLLCLEPVPRWTLQRDSYVEYNVLNV